MAIVEALQTFQSLINTGHLRSAIQHGKVLLEDQAVKTNSQIYIELCLTLANVLGRNESAEAEYNLLRHVQEYINELPDLNKDQARARVYYKLAYYSMNMLYYDDAFHWIEQALDAVGELAIPEWMVMATWCKARILYDVNGNYEVDQQNALVLTCAGIWESRWAADYLVGSQRLETPPLVQELIDSAEASNLKNVRQAIYDSMVLSSKESSELRSSLLEVWDSEEVITLGECWRLLYGTHYDFQEIIGGEAH